MYALATTVCFYPTLHRGRRIALLPRPESLCDGDVEASYETNANSKGSGDKKKTLMNWSETQKWRRRVRDGTREKQNPKTNKKTAIKFVATRRHRLFPARSRFRRQKKKKKNREKPRNVFFLMCSSTGREKKQSNYPEQLFCLASPLQCLPCWNRVGTTVFWNTKLNTYTVS